ncbi:MAG: hypothetical protein PHW10_06035, partial [Candidatus Peribacteraceae bacterium]|nr:hypothetical protein [Candidatus Peribacteraceae bacterium]
MRKLFPFLLAAAFLLIPLFRLQAAEPVTLYLFWGQGCPHCEAEKEALAEIVQDHPHLRIREFEVYRNPAHARLLQEVARQLGVNVSGVPFTIIGEKTFTGFSETVTRPQIVAQIEACGDTPCDDTVASIVGTAGDASSTSSVSSASSDSSVSSDCSPTASGCTLP